MEEKDRLELMETFRKKLKLKPGVVLSDEEIDMAVEKMPETTRERSEAEVEDVRRDVAKRQPKKRYFGGSK